MQCNAMQCNAMQCNAMQCNAMQCNAMQCNAMQGNAMQCNAMQCNAMQCNKLTYFFQVVQRREISSKSVQVVTGSTCGLWWPKGRIHACFIKSFLYELNE
jgi:hypothetical protein